MGRLCARVNLIVPFAVERSRFDMTFGQFFVGDLASFGIGRLVEPGMDFQAGVRGRVSDGLNDDFASLQRDALPVARDMTEQPMFNLIPFGRNRPSAQMLATETSAFSAVIR